MREPTPYFDDRENAAVAEAVLAVIQQTGRGYRDRDAVWEAFIDWRGRGEREYLRGTRAERKYVFYSVLHDLYNFAEEVCGDDVCDATGRCLAETLLASHLPDLLRTTLTGTGALWQQVMWLVSQFVAGACREIYQLEAAPSSDEMTMRLLFRYREEAQMIDYLKRSGHDPRTAFAQSFKVFRGALQLLLARVIYGYAEEQFDSEMDGLRGTFIVRFEQGNRFHFENLIDVLLDYVRRLRLRGQPEAQPALAEAGLHVSKAMKQTWQSVQKAASCDETVLLCGESGTGKSHYARLIHEMSGRRSGPFVEVGLTSEIGSDNLIQSNLFGHVRGAFTGANDEKQGLFALANDGTIFLDEIGDASAEVQAKLLRAIERKTFKMLGGVQDISVDVRIITATNRDLPEMVRKGLFREDLYYRLNVIPIVLPPLRARAEDIPALVHTLFERVCREANKQDKRLADETFGILSSHDWPGNIRELENALRHAVAFSDRADVGPDHLPAAVRKTSVDHFLPTRAGGSTGEVVDADALRKVLSAPRPARPAHDYEWQGHIDYARREYLKTLIDHYGGDLRELARHWDRSSEHTLRKLIRQLELQEHLQAARKRHG